MSLEGITISTSGKRGYQLPFLPRWTKKHSMNFVPLLTTLCLLIPTYPSSTVRAFSKNFIIWSHISGEEIELSMNEKCRLQLQSIPRRTQQKWWTWVNKQ